jgi:hypothetical protein
LILISELFLCNINVYSFFTVLEKWFPSITLFLQNYLIADTSLLSIFFGVLILFSSLGIIFVLINLSRKYHQTATIINIFHYVLFAFLLGVILYIASFFINFFINFFITIIIIIIITYFWSLSVIYS